MDGCVVPGGGARSTLFVYVTSHGAGDARARRDRERPATPRVLLRGQGAQ
jgi:hypothetical protein